MLDGITASYSTPGGLQVYRKRGYCIKNLPDTILRFKQNFLTT